MMKLFTAMAADGAAVASPAPPRPPNVPAGPRRDFDPAESSPRRHRGTAGAPIMPRRRIPLDGIVDCDGR